MLHLAFGQCANTLDQPDFSPEWDQMMRGVSEIVPLARQFPGIVQVAQTLPISFVKVLNPLMAKFSEFERVSASSMLCVFDKCHQASGPAGMTSEMCLACQSVRLIFMVI